jgi:ABC-type glutathione transport system ATPase component
LTGYAAHRCVLVVSHDPHVLCRAEFLYWLEAGRVCCGGPPQAVLAEVAAPHPHGAPFYMVNAGTRSSWPLARRPRTTHSGGPT